MKKQRTKKEWMDIGLLCETAWLRAPWWSPMRLLFAWGAKYAFRQASKATQ